jgi:predicted aminopeptidase
MFLVSPTGCYLSRAVWEEGKILGGRRQISDVLKDHKVDSVTRKKLRIVAAARLYARDSIGLNTGESFTTFSQLDRDTLLLVLSAAHRDQLIPYTWSFPIVGKIPYKGYFDFNAARRDAEKLQQEGYDTYLRPSSAFSTLGFFNDPLLSTTLAADSFELANTVIHEVTHNTFYAKGQAMFNESFASFVGARGAAAFFRARGQPEAAALVEARWEDDKLLGAFWVQLSNTLDSAFRAHPNDKSARLAARDSIYRNARQLLIDSIAIRFRTIPPLYAQRVHLDNASLLARRVYATGLDLFDAVWLKEGKDMKKTIARVIQLAESNPKDPYRAVREWVGE